ncbi:hypothetical protein [uncultured Meiothermus sp.]|jgi:hypothetical protein|uniref:hypothetical protein n=1 Tax=uncultured Meiothermus sp. TaxID=157471 RepID=UPI0026116C6C|nr:hypothetical protein [uncultured Meiothermus sp.]
MVLVLLGFLFFTPWPSPPTALPNPTLRQIWSYVEPTRREQLVTGFLQTKASAQALLGPAAAQAVARLVRAEFSNQALRRPAAFDTPEAALASSQAWLIAIRALKEGKNPDLRSLPIEPGHVLPHQLDVQNAARALGIPQGILAAIVDNEQMGGDKVFGFSREVRELADQLAAELAQNTGRSGNTGLISQTIGLTQMSWQDALQQEARIRRFGAWDPEQPFLADEAEARLALSNPYLNLLLTASRMRGYLNHRLGLAPNDTRTLSGYWLYYLGPAWHNWPPGANVTATWPYSFHGFFKGLFYEVLLQQGRNLTPTP